MDSDEFLYLQYRLHTKPISCLREARIYIYLIVLSMVLVCIQKENCVRSGRYSASKRIRWHRTPKPDSKLISYSFLSHSLHMMPLLMLKA
jgi:hypothetical protein